MIDETVEHGNRSMRTLFAIAGQIGSRLLEARSQRLRDARTKAEQAAREQKRDAERAANEQERQLQAVRTAEIGTLRAVERPEWWNNATPEQVADMWEKASGWAPVDKRARAAAETISQEVHDRYGIDMDRLDVDPADTMTQARQIASDRATATRLRAEAEQDTARADLLLAEAVAYDQLAREQRSLAEQLHTHINWDDPADRDLRIFERAESATDAATHLDAHSGGLLDQAARVQEEATWKAGHADTIEHGATTAERDLINTIDQDPSAVFAQQIQTADNTALQARTDAGRRQAQLEGPLTPEVPYDTADRAADAEQTASDAERAAQAGRDRAGVSSAEARAALAAAEQYRHESEQWGSAQRVDALRASLVNNKIDPEVIQHRMVTEHARPVHPAKAADNRASAPKARKENGQPRSSGQRRAR